MKNSHFKARWTYKELRNNMMAHLEVSRWNTRHILVMSKAKDKIQAESLSLFQHFCLKVAVQATGYGLWPSWGTGFKGGPGTDGKLVFTALILINHFCAGSNISIISVPFPSLFLFSGVFFLPINCFSTHIFKVQNR